MLYNICHVFSVPSWWPHVFWQAVTLSLVNSSAIRALVYSRCVMWRRSRDENHAVRFRHNAENRSRAWDMQPTRGVSDELARVCKRWHPLTPERRYGKKKFSLWDMSIKLYLKKQQTVCPLKNKMKRVCLFIEVRILCLIMFLLIFVLRLYNTNNSISSNSV